MSTKIPGYLLFYLGLISIIACAFSVYQVYTGHSPPVRLFNLPAANLNSEFLSMLGYRSAVANTSIELVPATIINQFANLFAHLILMGFLSGVGYKISLIGAQLLRPINIQVKETLKEVSAF